MKTGYPPPIKELPRFQGAIANRMAQKYWLSDIDLDKILAQEPHDPYMGSIPPEMEKRLNMPSQAIFKMWDKLATDARRLPERTGFGGFVLYLLRGYPSPPSPHPALKIEAENPGETGLAYTLKMGASRYLLKVARPSQIKSLLQEIATGYHLTHKPVKEICRLFAANPKTGWMLIEHLSENDDPSFRYGKTLSEAKVAVLDDHSGNRIGQLRVDYGGLVPLHGRYDTPPIREMTHHA